MAGPTGRTADRSKSGEGGIRTLGGVAATSVFETDPIGRSGTSPGCKIPRKNRRFARVFRGHRHYHYFVHRSLWGSVKILADARHEVRDFQRSGMRLLTIAMLQ